MNRIKLSGMRGFSVIWVGQVLSLVGTSMSGFALTIWAFQLTGSATALALVGFFTFTPQIVFSPIAGALVDRWNRKLVMALSDLAAAVATLAILILYVTGSLQIWHLYIAGAFTGLFTSFQWPAYSAAISTMIPKHQFARASGMISMAEWGSGVLSPALAGILIGVIGIGGILAIDIATFVIALLALAIVFIPQPVATVEGAEGKGSLWKESLYGFRYILKRPSLLGLQLVFFGGNLMSTIGIILINPMILSRTNNDPTILGTVLSAGSAAGIAGSLYITASGGPKPRILGVLAGWLVSGVGLVLYGLGASMWMWILAAMVSFFVGPVVNASNQAIWQAKVAPDVQGRVFSVRRLIAQISAPVSLLAAGPLADRVVEPLMQDPSSVLSRVFGDIFGRGQGSGMSLIIAAGGILIAVVAIIGALIPRIRNVESILPDQVQQPALAAEPAE